MDNVQLVCRGFDVGGCYVPAFEARTGSATTLRMPAGMHRADLLMDILTGSAPCREVRIVGQCVAARPAQPPLGWRRWFFDPLPATWLTKHGFSLEKAREVAARHGIDNRFSLSRHAATPRMLLGLEAAYQSQPTVIVFNTSGLDPNGKSAVYDVVRSRLAYTAAIYLAAPFISQGIRQYPFLPGSQIIEIMPQAAVTI